MIDNTTIRQSFDPKGRHSFLFVLSILLLILAGAFAWQLKSIIDIRSSVVGDGRTIESYNYDLSNFTGNRALLAPYMSKDGQLALVNPAHIDISVINAETKADESVAASLLVHGRTIVSDDLVIGVTINGESRAYPISILNWHEIVNDTLGNVPIAVTYSPITRGAVVFNRSVNNQTLEFGYSGLFYNHHLLMYDRQQPLAASQSTADSPNQKMGSDPVSSHGESLWSQMLFQSVSGPQAGTKLTVIPAELTRWKHWHTAHPDTTLLEGDPTYKKRYKRSPYSDRASYGLVAFPVDPLEKGDGGRFPDSENAVTFNRFDFIAAIQEGDHWRVIPHHGDTLLQSTTPVAYAMWFVWHAAHPDDSLVEWPDQAN